MFSLAFLEQIRAAELDEVFPFLPAGSRILEIGAGTGFQGRLLHEHGYSVECIDVADSIYGRKPVFPVRTYDGVNLPFDDKTFDVVFSSNVLEHVADLAPLLAEVRRVLKPRGHCVHLMPTSSWRVWSIVTHYPNLPILLVCLATDSGSGPFPRTAKRNILHLIGRALWPGRHGEHGTMLGEIALFSRRRWTNRFREHGFAPVAVRPVKLFYTGNMLFGGKLPLMLRRRLAAWLGSGSALYVVEPSPSRRD